MTAKHFISIQTIIVICCKDNRCAAKLSVAGNNVIYMKDHYKNISDNAQTVLYFLQLEQNWKRIKSSLV